MNLGQLRLILKWHWQPGSWISLQPGALDVKKTSNCPRGIVMFKDDSVYATGSPTGSDEGCDGVHGKCVWNA